VSASITKFYNLIMLLTVT